MNRSLLCGLVRSFRQSCRHISRRKPNPGKPPIVPPAKSKRYRVVHVKWQESQDVEELVWRRHAYYDALKSIRRYYQEQLNLGTKTSAETKNYELQDEEEFQQLLLENDQINRQQAELRKARQKAELNEVNEQLSRLIKDHVERTSDSRRLHEAEVLEMIEKSKDFVTAENLEEKINEALENPVDFNFAVDLSGNVYTGKAMEGKEATAESKGAELPVVVNDSFSDEEAVFYSANTDMDEFHDCKSDIDDMVQPEVEAVTNDDVKIGSDASCNPGSSESCEARGEYFIDETYLSEAEALISDEQKTAKKEMAISLKEQGNRYFKDGDYRQAAVTYTDGLRTCPPSFKDIRAVLYSNRAACFVKMEMLKEGLEDCSAAIELDPSYLKALRRRAQINESKEEWWDNALADYKLLLASDPGDKKAQNSVLSLPGMIEQRNERTKAEMIKKLKELGNRILKPFGLSTNNFKMEQNPDGSYAVKMQR
ncbi:unnamed protein product [Soboliphyme baturini]|uniref:TPR_REGION domain-containing protein n=1 Tax=Soboliphyme baturini TaxID=241478 RepID=A0A183I8R1_9BILA|nr:unnamed protein product [Soboliphyme baturini]